MKKIMLCLAAALIGSTALMGQTKSKQLHLGAFSRIDASGVYEVTIKKGEPCAVSIEYPEEMEEYLDIYTQNGELNLKFKERSFFERLFNYKEERRRKVAATVTLPELVALDLSGTVRVFCQDAFRVNQFDVEMSGVSKVEGLEVYAHEVEIELSGASKLNISGKADLLKIQSSGASDMICDLFFDEAIIGASGACGLDFPDVAANRIAIGASGACKMHFSGTARNVQYKGSGACNYNGTQLEVKKMDVRISGACNMGVFCTDELVYSASGTCHFRYRGNPTCNISTSGASNIKKMD